MSRPRSSGVKRSIVWEFYDKETSSENVTCKLCNLRYKHFGNTTNLISHLKRKHPVEFTETNDASWIQQQQPSSSTSAPSNHEIAIVSVSHLKDDSDAPDPLEVNTLNASTVKKKRKQFVTSSSNLTEDERKVIDDALLDMIILDCQPLRIVEKPGFKLFTQRLYSPYVLPTKKSLSEDILPERYFSERNTTEHMLENVNYITLSANIWISDAHKGYLTITAHFIYEFKLYSVSLSTTQCTYEQSSFSIANTIRDVLDSWKIASKVVAVVTDDDFNIKEAVSKHLNLKNVVCVGHTLNYGVDQCIQNNSELSELLAACHNITTYFNDDTSATSKLKELQQDMKCAEVKLKKNFSTKWDSILTMMQRMMELRTPLSTALSVLESAPENLNSNQWNLVSDCIVVLQPIDKIIKELSRQHFEMLSCTIPLIRGLQNAIKNRNLITQSGRELQLHLLTFIDTHLEILEVDYFAANASFLDPRFKKIGFGVENNAQNATQAVIQELAAKSGMESCETETKVFDNPIFVNTDSDDELWENFNKKVAHCLYSTTPVSSSFVIVNQYLELSLLNRKEDPLYFWKQHSQVFPDLSKLAMKYLCVPATSVPTERIFSKYGELWNQDRNRLNSKNINEMLFLNSCLRNKYKYV